MFEFYNQREKEKRKKEEEKKRKENEKQAKEQAKKERINNYNLEEISSLINIIGESNDIKKLNINNISFNDKTYSIEKENDDLIIKCSDGRCLKLKIYSCSWEESDGYFSKWTCNKSVAEFQYLLPNGNTLSFTNDSWHISMEYEFFKKLNPAELVDNLTVKYLIPNKNSIIPYGSYPDQSWDFNRLETYNRYFNFTSDGILYCNDYLVSSDGKQLLSIKGKDVLPLEKVKQFNIEQEKEKLIKLLESDNTIHPYTRDVLLNAINNLKNKEKYVNNILEFYNEDIPLCQEVANAREDLINNIYNYIFSKEELLFLIKILAQEIKKIYIEKKNAEDFYNSPDERAKRLVKSLSKEELNALKRKING